MAVAVGVLLLLVTGIQERVAQRASVTEHAGTWSARASTGLTLAGAWTAIPDAAARTVRGTWTLVDAKRSVVAQGAWSAAKAASGWSGSWRAVAAGQRSEYSG